MVCALLIFAAFSRAPDPAAAQTRQAVDLVLVLAVDTSSSIVAEEYAVQAQGYADAFRDPLIIGAIEDLGPGGLGVTFLQWSASFQMFQSVGWSHVHDAASAEKFAADIEINVRRYTAFGTALGDAIGHSVDLIAKGPFYGQRQVIDISADERSNMGAHPAGTRDRAAAAGIIVNGLAILNTQIDLVDYFRMHVITGPDAFVIVVENKDDIAASIKRKLLREIIGPVAMLPDAECPRCRSAITPAKTPHRTTRSGTVIRGQPR